MGAVCNLVDSHEGPPSVLNTMPDPETYFERLTEFYLPYSQGGGQEDVTKII